MTPFFLFSGVHASPRMVKAEKGNSSWSILTSRTPDIVDIDASRKDPELCCLYAPDIYNNLHVAEVCAINTFFGRKNPFK